MKKHFKKFLSVALAVAMTTSFATGIKVKEAKAASQNYNYAEAMQKGIMFYEFQKSGDLSNTIERNNWRGNSGMDDGSDVGVDLTGGWYDAGDHVKFNLPMSYTSTMLAWSYLEDKDVYTSSGEDKYMLDEIKWANDYFIKCHVSPNEYYYQVGDGGLDHAFWGSAEIMQMKRPAYKLDKSNPGSAVSAETAASLAACAMVFKDTDPSYADSCLTHAKQLLNFAEETKSDSGYMKAAAGYYSSFSGFYDELSWGSLWIYMATDDEDYLEKAISYSDNWERVTGTDTIAYKWAHGWDDVHIGSSLLLAKLTGDEKFKTAIENNLNYWSVGVNGEKIKYTPKGLAWLDTWGSLRYSATTAFLASVYADWEGCSEKDAKNYREFAKSQADYMLGSTGRSFVVGFGENAPERPHHRTAHGAYENNLAGNPKYHRHTLVGALVGGPDASDGYSDDVSDYVSNEVACDYNAGFVGLMAKMYKNYGGTLVKDLNANEEPEEELYMEAGINAKDSSNTLNFLEVKAVVYNKTSWPARVTDKLKYRYFIDISDVLEAGYSAKDMTVSANYNQSKAKLSDVKPWDAENGIYYVEIDLTGAKIYPGGQSEYKSELQFRIAAPGKWDFTKSPSYKDIANTSGNKLAKANNIALYDDGKLVFGSEPKEGSKVEQEEQGQQGQEEQGQEEQGQQGQEEQGQQGQEEQGQEEQGQQPENAMKFVVDTDKNTGSSNTINIRLNMTNNESDNIDLSKLSFRYYFTADNDKDMTIYYDEIAGNFTQSPWYKNYSDSCTGKVVKMTSAKTNADRYVEFKFDSNDKLSKGAKLTINARLAKNDWSNFDLDNDFSAGDGKIAVYYDGKLVAGMEP